jgi:divalent metal cation (Fe/Co/Zn/Cd) transporter
VGQGHAAADAVEAAVERALPNADVVVHVEPIEAGDLRERAHAAAIAVPAVREVHNIALVDVDGRKELSLHIKLPGGLPLDEAHDVAEKLESSIRAAVPEIAGVQTHLEPIDPVTEGREVGTDSSEVVRQIVLGLTGAEPRELRFLRTDNDLVAFLTLGLEGSTTLADAHAKASEIEEAIRRERPEIADVIVHTEP